ncbi:MAG: hypothetical protein KF749_07545 [Bacteroidetes bacterium]|nr:hypothetical protein [Bacteroidota bacterium]MCW5896839.1 hypothetical protein [Bacteroidota bacterium]
MANEDSTADRQSPFIKGIDEYCDRWCERCAFTKRCYAYAMDEGPLREGTYQTVEEFLDAIEEPYILSIETMKEILGDDGLNFTDEELQSFRQVYKDMCLEVRELPLAIEVLRYGTFVGEWFEKSRSVYEEKADELESEDEMGISDPRSTFDAIENANEVIYRYRSLILEKVIDALATRRIVGGDSHYINGSTKVALICIDRSCEAWHELTQHLHSESDALWDVIVQLEQMRKSLEQEFPDARKFIRPGFDQET